MKFQTIRTFLLFVAALSVVLATTACPKSKTDQLRAAIDASYRLPAATNDVIRQVGDARDKGLITVEQARTFGEGLNRLAKAEVKFVEMVKAANEVFKVTNRIDPATQSELRTFFDADLIGPFLSILEAAKLLSGPQVELITLAIAAVRLLIHTIAGGIGSKNKKAVAMSGGDRYQFRPARTVLNYG